MIWLRPRSLEKKLRYIEANWLSVEVICRVGNWDAGGIVLPSGESGEPGSGHYDDLMRTWVKGSLVALPFSQRAVARATIETLSMTP